VSSEQRPAAETEPGSSGSGAPGGGNRKRNWILFLAAILVLNVLAIVFVPPFPRDEPGEPCAYPACWIEGSLEFPQPHVVYDFDPANAPEGLPLLQAHPSITSSIFTMWIVMAILLVVLIWVARTRQTIPGTAQNIVEAVYDGLSNFATSLGGPAAKRYVPLFAGLFILIVCMNWSGLLPFVGRIHEFRAPTSDVNTTIGMALVSFAFFHIEGIRALGVRAYLAKFFPVGEFRKGVGAGIIGMFVGLIELLLEFVKPLTLSMRLFGNIYGGEVALGVIFALTVAIIPVALVGLEVMLNLVQALIFSVLTLMFILAAIEGHHDDDHASESAHGDAHQDAHQEDAREAHHPTPAAAH
jgi:F-type H+-transporting ATPase subunit a